MNSREQIQTTTGLPNALIQDVLNFLVEKGLCRYNGKEYLLGPALTHLEASSRFISRNHVNWRLRVIENHPRLDDDDLIFTAPLTISRKDSLKVREQLVRFVKELGDLVTNSPGEKLQCLNIDWVEIFPNKIKS